MICMLRPGLSSSVRVGCWILGLWLASGPVAEAAPKITKLNLRGLQLGGSVALVVEGSELLPEPKLLLPIPVQQELKPGAKANRLEFTVTLAADAQPGIYPLRIATTSGVSDAEMIAVDALPQLEFKDQLDSLPAALSGRVGGPVILATKFPGKKGMPLVIEIAAQRLNANIEPSLRLFDSRHRQLAWGHGRISLGGDARIALTLPADDMYQLEVHDLQYKGGTNNHFRIALGELKYADLVFPLGGQRGTKTSLVPKITNFPPDTKLEVDLGQARFAMPAPLPAAGRTAASPQLLLSEIPEILEITPEKDKLQEVTVPAAINGVLSQPKEEDRYLLHVQAGQKLRFRVFANQAGSPLDATLSVRNEQNGQLAANDDRSDTIDPGLDFTVPKNVTKLIVALRDVIRSGSPNHIYRIAVERADLPEFDLTLDNEAWQVPQNGAAVGLIKVRRGNYNGPIELFAEGLPPGVQLSGNVIPANATQTLLSLSAPTDALIAAASVQILGKAGQGDLAVTRPVLLADSQAGVLQPWLRWQLAAAVTRPAPLALAWETASDGLPRGYKAKLKVRVQRGEKAVGPVRLSLLTSQIVPTKKEANKDVPDLDKALRLADKDGLHTLAADKNETELELLVPGDLPDQPFDLVLKAELLDNQKVLGTALTASRRASPIVPLKLELAGPNLVEARAGEGPTGSIQGKLIRAAGFDAPVLVQLEGLPKEFPPIILETTGEATTFELPVRLPFETAPKEHKKIKLVGLVGTLKTAPLEVAVKVVPGEASPLPAALTTLFEDEVAFPALLTEGDGQATLDRTDRYAGTAALKLTPKQRLRANAPGWKFKIRENPGPGEFRYIRFAWKSVEGQNLLFELQANGAFGPQIGKSGPTYRYEAGTKVNATRAAANKLSPKVPEKWEVVTRDLFADFGEFSLDGIGFAQLEGKYALFDQIYLARTQADFDQVLAPLAAEAAPPPKAATPPGN